MGVGEDSALGVGGVAEAALQRGRGAEHHLENIARPEVGNGAGRIEVEEHDVRRGQTFRFAELSRLVVSLIEGSVGARVRL